MPQPMSRISQRPRRSWGNTL